MVDTCAAGSGAPDVDRVPTPRIVNDELELSKSGAIWTPGLSTFGRGISFVDAMSEACRDFARL